MERISTMGIRNECYRDLFSESLVWRRAYAGLSREELAKKTGLELSEIARLEEAMITPSPAVKDKLQEAIGCPLYYGKHRQVKVQVGNMKAKVDEGIAPLIQEMWRANIGTVLSCQQNTRGRIWIMFPCGGDIARLLNIILRDADEDKLSWRIIQKSANRELLPDWEYTPMYADSVRLIDLLNPQQTTFHFRISVRFPPQDLLAVLQRLKEHNVKKGKDSGKRAPMRSEIVNGFPNSSAIGLTKLAG